MKSKKNIFYLHSKFVMANKGNSIIVPIKFNILMLIMKLFNVVLKCLFLNKIYKRLVLKNKLMKNKAVEYNEINRSL
jgi:hypothetical protein